MVSKTWRIMMNRVCAKYSYFMLTLLLVFVSAGLIYAAELEQLPSDPYFADFKPVKAPVTESLLLKEEDRLGDLRRLDH